MNVVKTIKRRHERRAWGLADCQRNPVGSRAGAVLVGAAYLFLPVSFGSARPVQKHKRTQDWRSGAVSIVIDPWRAPDLGRVGGDVGDSGSPYAQRKHRPATGCHAPGRRPGPERASRLRRGSPGLDSGPLGRSLFRRCTALSATRFPPLAQTWHSKIEIRDQNGVVAPLWLRAKSAYGGGRGMFRA